MEARELARIVGINRDTLRRFERSDQLMRPAALDKIRLELEKRGVVFTFTRNGRPLGIEDANSLRVLGSSEP
jgi:hypothetical protein